MKRLVLGILVSAALVMTAVAVAQPRGDGFAPRPATMLPSAGSELIVIPTALADQGQMLTVVDPRQRVLCVYHIEPGKGTITLKSVRNIQYDLQVTEFNNSGLTTNEVKSQVEQIK